MARAVRLKETERRKRLLGHVRFLAEEALAPNLFRRFVERLTRDHPCRIGLLNYDGRLRLLPEGAVNDMDERDLTQYRSHFSRLNPYPRLMAKHGLMDRTVRLSDYLSPADLEKTEYYNDFMRPLGHKHTLSLSILMPGIGRTTLTLYRGSREGGEFTDDEVRRVNELRPFLRNTVLLRALIRERACEGKSIEGLVDPAFLVESEQEIEPLNAAGDQFLCKHCKGDVSDSRGASDGGGRMAYSLPAEMLFNGKETGRIVILPPEAGPHETLRNRLRARFSLTPMEAVVAQALLDGLSYKEIAQEYEISTETVHSHVKAIHRKADVTTTRQFTALVVARS